MCFDAENSQVTIGTMGGRFLSDFQNFLCVLSFVIRRIEDLF